MNERPTLLPWHATLWENLRGPIREQRLAHAVLISGSQGVGKRELARLLTWSLLCESRQADGFACGRCRGCQLLGAGNHPNLIWLSRELNEKTKEEKRDISMEQVRDTIARLSLASHYQQPRVVVIDPADALNANGVNALLKTVEEPPPNSYIVLIAERPMALAATLRSRCQKLRCPLPERALAEAWLRDQGDAAAIELLDRAGGAPLRALEDLRSGLADRRKAWRSTWLRLADRQANPLAAASEVAKDEAREWVGALLGFLGEILRGRWQATDDPQLAALSHRMELHGLEILAAECLDALRRFQSNANPQLVVESLMILWWHRAASTPKA